MTAVSEWTSIPDLDVPQEGRTVGVTRDPEPDLDHDHSAPGVMKSGYKPPPTKKPRKEKDTNVYEVEKILDIRVKRGVEEVKVKWVGYDAEWYNTWEPVTNLNEDSFEHYQRILEDKIKLERSKEKKAKIKRPRAENKSGSNEPGQGTSGSGIPNCDGGSAGIPEPDSPFDDPNLTFKRIIGISGTKEEPSFVIVFDIDGAADEPVIRRIPMALANAKIPYQVIDFYEARVCYVGDPKMTTA